MQIPSKVGAPFIDRSHRSPVTGRGLCDSGITTQTASSHHSQHSLGYNMQKHGLVKFSSRGLLLLATLGGYVEAYHHEVGHLPSSDAPFCAARRAPTRPCLPQSHGLCLAAPVGSLVILQTHRWCIYSPIQVGPLPSQSQCGNVVKLVGASGRRLMFGEL